MPKSIIKKSAAFTIAELIVVITIIAILSVAAVTGLGGTSEKIAIKQSAQVIRDVIHNAEFELMGEGDISSVTIHFLPDYLVQEEDYNNSSAEMSINYDCGGNDGLYVETSGVLYKSRDNGASFDSEYITGAPVPFCFDFKSADSAGWIFRLEDGSDKKVMKFMHFNLQRDDGAEQFVINNSYSVGGVDYNLTDESLYLTITYPDMQKHLYAGGKKVSGTLSLTVTDGGGLNEDLDMEF